MGLHIKLDNYLQLDTRMLGMNMLTIDRPSGATHWPSVS